MFDKGNDQECGAGAPSDAHEPSQFTVNCEPSNTQKPFCGNQDARLKKKRNKRTGGPQTVQGKAVASKNSETHGAYSLKLPVTDDYYAYSELVQRELRPTGPLQQEVVDSAAFDSYKSIKLREIERRNLLRAEQAPVSAKKLAELTGYPWSDTHLQMLAEPINSMILKRFIYKSWKLLAKPKVLADTAEAQSTSDRMVTELYEEGCRLLSAAGLCQFNEEAFFAKLDVVMLEARVQKNYLGKRIKDSGAEVVLVQYWLYRNAARVSQAIHQLQDDKVVDVLSEEGMVRAKAHVSNSLRNNISNLESLKAMKGRDTSDVYRRIEQAAQDRLRYDAA
jgi:hypothetical protein